MKCVRCSTELPGQAQFCLKCGTPVAAMQNSTVTMARPVAATPIRSVSASNASRPKTGLYLGIAAGVIALAAMGFGIQSLMNKGGRTPGGSNVVDATGHAPDGSRIMDANGRLGRTAPLTTSAGTPGPTPLDPAEVIDYLKFLKDIERSRIVLVKQNEGQIKALIPMTEAGNLMAQMKDNEGDISKAQNDTYNNMQKKISDISSQWLELSNRFQARRPPQSCQQLANYYYDALGKTSSAIVSVANAFSQAMQGMSSGDTSKVSDIVTKLQGMDGSGMGSPSKAVDDACGKADSELGAVCDKFRIHKDFDIRPDGGGASPFGLGG
jgi:hypothetical protein